MTTITKTTCELYKLRGLPHSGWADITIDAAAHHGRIQVASDWGSWQYFWGHCGMPFKTFLGTIGIDYAASKFNQDSFFDSEGTIKRYRDDVRANRRENNLDRETARKIFDEIGQLEDANSESSFTYELGFCKKLMKFYEGCPDLRYKIRPQFRYFWEKVWPLLLAEFDREASEEIQNAALRARVNSLS